MVDKYNSVPEEEAEDSNLNKQSELHDIEDIFSSRFPMDILVDEDMSDKEKSPAACLEEKAQQQDPKKLNSEISKIEETKQIEELPSQPKHINISKTKVQFELDVSPKVKGNAFEVATHALKKRPSKVIDDEESEAEEQKEVVLANPNLKRSCKIKIPLENFSNDELKLSPKVKESTRLTNNVFRNSIDNIHKTLSTEIIQSNVNIKTLSTEFEIIGEGLIEIDFNIDESVTKANLFLEKSLKILIKILYSISKESFGVKSFTLYYAQVK